MCSNALKITGALAKTERNLYQFMKNKLIFLIILFSLTACSSVESQYEMPIATYSSISSEQFNVSIELFRDNTGSIVLHQFQEATIPVERGEVLSV